MTPEQLIDATNARVVLQVADADNRMGVAMLQAQQAWLQVMTPYTLDVPIGLPVERPPFNPNTDLSFEFKNSFAESFGDFHDDMLDGLADYLARFFPECITTNTDNWICNTILTGGQGVPAAIEAMIWQRGRSRENLEAVKLEREAIDQFAQRGFVMPAGALAARLLEVQQDNANKASTLSRDVAIKTFDAYREDIKFAVEQGVKVRLGVLNALSDYLRAWMFPQGSAADYARATVDAKSKLWSSGADYYRAIISEAELTLKAHQIMQPSYDTTQIETQNGRLKLIADVIATARQMAELNAQIAASSAASLVAVTGQDTSLFGSVAA